MTVAHEAAEGDAAVLCELDGETRGRADCDDEWATHDGGFLHELERQAAADAENVVPQRQQAGCMRRADHLVQRVVPADVLAHAQQRARGVEEAGCVEPARCAAHAA